MELVFQVLILVTVSKCAGDCLRLWLFSRRSSLRARSFTFTVLLTRLYQWKQWKLSLRSSGRRGGWWGLAICRLLPMLTISGATRSSTVSSLLISWKRSYHQHMRNQMLFRFFLDCSFFTKPTLCTYLPAWTADRKWNGADKTQPAFPKSVQFSCIPIESRFRLNFLTFNILIGRGHSGISFVLIILV